MIRPLGRIAAALLPALGLAALWGQSHHTFQQGTEWEVPVEGYDPRDYLRGHYVEFTYDWPGVEQWPRWRNDHPFMLCLEGDAPRIARVTVHRESPCAHPVRGDPSGVYGLSALTMGRLYLGQARAETLQRELQDSGQRGVVTIRQRDDGSFTPIAIRFRPLTPDERAQREARNQRAEESLPPPPIIPQ
ncbi:MAG: GDYXXLXY domain-containing protein [Sphingomonadales bacterium]|nr:GDYXXLXY domain-containing protein [Sphingomonadales bacterium]NCQ20620.1 GDYXXLXY domain-containing protein [Sphingomonadales bacterium]NCT04126.1 GDYXXLXY domain-containing protein [Sphingomonadales bacterium]